MINNKKFALCITVYKHRTNKLLSHISEIRNDIDVYIVVQDNDPNILDYNQYLTADNIKIMNTTATSIFEKREAVRNITSEMGYDYYFMIDDDMLFKSYHITEETKRTTSDSYRKFDSTFGELIDKMISVIFEYNAGFVTPMSEFYLGFGKPNGVTVNKGINCGQFVLVDINKINEANIHYDTTGEVHEDVDFVYQLLKNKITCVTIKDYACAAGNNWLGSNVEASTLYSSVNALYKFILNQYVRWHWPIATGGKKHDKLNMRTPFNKIWGQEYFPEADPTLLELCKSGDSQAVIDYINTKRNIK